MKIGIQTWGSNGDIRPLLALAQGLQKAGHSVTLAVTSIDNKDYSDVCFLNFLSIAPLSAIAPCVA